MAGGGGREYVGSETEPVPVPVWSPQCGSTTVSPRRAFITSSLTCECGRRLPDLQEGLRGILGAPKGLKVMWCLWCFRVTGGELFEDIVAREYYSEADAR